MKRIIPLFFLILLLVTGCDESASVHEVVFDDSYGTTFTQDVYDGKTVVKPYKNPSAPVEAKKGKFKEWIIRSESGAETVYDFSQPVKRDLYLYATYYDLYTVYFLNGTSLFSTADVSEGDKVEKPSSSPVDPSMGALEGWAKDPERPRETSYDFNTPVTSSFNLYAYYREAKYVTLLDPDGKQIGERIKVDYKDLLPVPDVKECGEKLIEKWQVKRGDNWEDYDFSLPVETDLTLRAVCYDTIPSKTLSTEEVLSVMRFAEILASMSGFEKGDGTTSGFKNTDLIKLFLAGSNGVDPETLNFRYPNNGTYYELYIPGESLNVPENILYYEITSETKAGRYNRSCEDGTTKIEADDFSIIVNLAKGKIENGSVVIDGDFFDKTSISLTLKSVDLTMDKGGNIEIKYWAGSRYYVFTMANESTDKSTVSTLVLKKTDKEDTTRSGSGACRMTFCTITFDPDNGEDVRSVKRIASSGGATVSKPDSDPLDSELNPTFRFWTKNGVEYDFSSKITENTVLKARYFTHEDYYNKILVAECIYKIPTLLSKYDKLYNGENIFANIFPNDDSTDHDLAEILLSAVFSIAPGSEKLYVTYNGDKYDYEDNTSSYTIVRLIDQIKIDVNKSSKDGNTEKIKIDNFLLALQYKYKANPEALWATVKETFSIDATIVTGDKGTKVTTATLKAGDKTYSTLTATTTTLSDGKSEVVFEYEGVRFKRTY